MTNEALVGVEVGILGPLTVTVGGRVAATASPKERALLAVLALQPGRVVSPSALIDGLWGEDPPQSAQKTLQGYVSGLRKILPPDVLLTQSGGYQLAVSPEAVDAHRFETLVRAAHASDNRGDTADAITGLMDALDLWRGSALMDCLGHQALDSAAQRLEELRRNASEDLGELRLGVGDHRQLIADLEASVAAEPLRERRWAQLMVALYRSGRQADAVRTYQRLVIYLGEEVGLEPSSKLAALEQAILVQSPELDWKPSELDRPDSRSGVLPAVREGLAHGLLLQSTIGADDLPPVKGSLRHTDGSVTPIPPEGLRIGRAPDNDIVLDHLRASRYHASIVRSGRGFLVSDLESTNGVSVGGEQVEHKRTLQEGDVLEIGTHRFVFETIR